MDPLERADAVISRARALHRSAVCPGDAGSPMDRDVTITVPRSVISSCDSDSDSDSASDRDSATAEAAVEAAGARPAGAS